MTIVFEFLPQEQAKLSEELPRKTDIEVMQELTDLCVKLSLYASFDA